MIVETPKAKIKSEGQAVAGKTKESKAKCGQLFSWLLMHSRKTFFRGRDGVEVVFKDFNLKCSSLPLFIFPENLPDKQRNSFFQKESRCGFHTDQAG